MEFPQRTIGELIESEKLLVLTAPDRYGAYYDHALAASVFLSLFVKSVDRSRWIFVRYLAQVKKYHTLALFSTVRLHQVQSLMNLRQVLEAGACAAFAIANPDHQHFVAADSQGLVNQSQALTSKIYAWLDKNYPDGSKSIKETKQQINASAAHANLVYTNNIFEMKEKEGIFSAPFFDLEDDYYVKTDLWRIGKIAIVLLDLFYGVNRERNAVRFVDDFLPRLQVLIDEDKRLHAGMTSSERYKRAMEKAAQIKS